MAGGHAWDFSFLGDVSSTTTFEVELQLSPPVNCVPPHEALRVSHR
jgi:hypothetical protein